MKNAINYYYNLYPNDVHQQNKNYFFTTESGKYAFLIYNRKKEELEELYQISNHLIQNNIPSHQIVLNSKKEIITIINNNQYILLKIFVEKRKININDINQLNINFNLKDSVLNKHNWHKLWCDKIDYFEEQISEYGRKYPIIRNSFNYYIGLAETAISLIKNKSSSELTLSHYRVYINDTLFELFNPLNFIIDSKVRDTCEYFKNAFFNNKNITNQLLSYILKLNKNEMQIFFARLLYPSYYFDIYEEIIKETSQEEKIEKIIIKVNDFEKLLNTVYSYIKDYMEDVNIEWLNKNVGY